MPLGTCRAVFVAAILLTTSCPGGGSMTTTHGQTFSQVRHGVHVSGPGTRVTPARCVGDCLLMGGREDGCRSISYDSDTGQCYVNTVDIGQTNNASIRHAQSSVYVSLQQDPWTMVFNARAGNRLNVMEAWNDVGHFDDVTSTSYGCITVDSRLPCDRHFRFGQLDAVPKLEEAKFSFYSLGELVAHVIFDAGSAQVWNDVFRFDKITNSSFEDMTLDDVPKLHEQCSIEGIVRCDRRFYLTSIHNTCGKDVGWMFVSDTLSANSGCCPFDQARSVKPMFRYSTLGHSANYSSQDLGFADVFVVYVKV